jgi:hypothetical protein
MIMDLEEHYSIRRGSFQVRKEGSTSDLLGLQFGANLQENHRIKDHHESTALQDYDKYFGQTTSYLLNIDAKLKFDLEEKIRSGNLN